MSKLPCCGTCPYENRMSRCDICIFTDMCERVRNIYTEQIRQLADSHIHKKLYKEKCDEVSRLRDQLEDYQSAELKMAKKEEEPVSYFNKQKEIFTKLLTENEQKTKEKLSDEEKAYVAITSCLKSLFDLKSLSDPLIKMELEDLRNIMRMKGKDTDEQ